MRRLLWLPLVAVLGVLSVSGRVPGQQDDFGVLKTTPATPAPRTLPPGIEPVQSAAADTTRVVNPFPISAEAGPWMICATTYVGQDGAELARQVVLDLRNKNRLGAYIFNRGDEERQRQREEFEALKKRYPPGTPLRRRGYLVQDQFAVLVGGFKDMESASAFLPRLKKLPPPVLKLQDGQKNPYEVLTYEEMDPQTRKVVKKTGLVHPYHNAMVVRNPAVPAPKVAKPRWDPFWKQLNAHEEFSLLRNPKAWTLVVKEYSGARVIQEQANKSSFLTALGFGGSRGGEMLDASAMQANALAKFLRDQKIGLTPWVLHTRHSSVVSVGGFDSRDDPELMRTVELVGKLRFTPKGGGADPVGLLPNPIAIEVPRP